MLGSSAADVLKAVESLECLQLSEVCQRQLSQTVEDDKYENDKNVCRPLQLLVSAAGWRLQATLAAASRTHLNLPPNCQRQSCSVGNVGARLRHGSRMFGIKMSWSEIINLFASSTTFEVN